MRFTIILSLPVMLALASVAPVQTKISSTVQCGNPDQQHILEVENQPHQLEHHGQARIKTVPLRRTSIAKGGSPPTD